jgi:NAD(P)-dependent dehydrogenase (short-subunit alcohol dehydrogenase family)
MMRSLESKLATGSLDEIRGRLEASIPAMRYGTVEEISSVVAFLASEDARYMNGSIITVDGGYTAR